MSCTFCFIVCDNFYPEMKAAVELQGLSGVEVRSFPARCGCPPISHQEMDDCVKGSEADVVEIFGSYCLRDITDPPAESSRCRINKQEQCLHLICGSTLVDTLQQDGVYLLSPGWLSHWREHITDWGFDRTTAIAFFKESLNKLFLIDTGTDSNAAKHLAEFGDFIQLPGSRLSIGLEFHRLFLAQIVADYRTQKLLRQKEKAERQAADSAMTLELIGMVTQAKSRPEVISSIVELFTMLFAPEKIHFIPVSKTGIHFDQVPGLTTEEHLQAQRFHTRHDRQFWLNETQDSFFLRIGRKEKTSALVLVSKVAFPQYIDAYINTSLTIAEVCALSLEHVCTLKKLFNASRLAGKAEVATEVLHNVGNTLNSISVSSEHIREMVQGSSGSTLPEIVELIEEHRHDLGYFLDHDPRGRKLPLYFSRLSEKLREETVLLLAEADRQFRHIRRVAEIIQTQQDVAKEVNLIEQIDLAAIIEESLDSFLEQFQKQQITVERSYDSAPVIYGESHKILQVVNNLISNAVDSFGGMKVESRKICLRLYQVDSTGEHKKIALEVMDNGQGMEKKILQRIFNFGFTTKDDGHGFGLHNAANLTAEMRGTLTAESSGPGRGTMFRMQLPVTASGERE